MARINPVTSEQRERASAIFDLRKNLGISRDVLAMHTAGAVPGCRRINSGMIAKWEFGFVPVKVHNLTGISAAYREIARLATLTANKIDSLSEEMKKGGAS